jgi:DNA polymerase elongation subunit (family B)
MVIEKHYFIKRDVKQGILSNLVENLVNERKQVRKKQKSLDKTSVEWLILEKRQKGIKISANSVYGALGTKTGKISFVPAAKCITHLGRSHILQVNDDVEQKYGGRVVYNDTDSTMFTMPGVSGKKCVEEGERIAADITTRLPKGMNLEYEKAGNALFLKKKMYRYRLMNDDTGELIPIDKPGSTLDRGTVMVRRDTSIWKRNIFNDMISMIMDEHTFDSVLNRVYEHMIKLIRRQIPIRDLTVNKSMGSSYKREHPNQLFEQEAKKFGVLINAGDRFDFIVVDDRYGREKIGYRMRTIDMLMTINEQLQEIKNNTSPTPQVIHNTTDSSYEQFNKSPSLPSMSSTQSQVVRYREESSITYYMTQMSRVVNNILGICFSSTIEDHMYSTTLRQYRFFSQQCNMLAYTKATQPRSNNNYSMELAKVSQVYTIQLYNSLTSNEDRLKFINGIVDYLKNHASGKTHFKRLAVDSFRKVKHRFFIGKNNVEPLLELHHIRCLLHHQIATLPPQNHI